ncbi:MAG: hypothetical protein ACRDOG_00490 [Gaiellaceae bacterium]
MSEAKDAVAHQLGAAVAMALLPHVARAALLEDLERIARAGDSVPLPALRKLEAREAATLWAALEWFCANELGADTEIALGVWYGPLLAMEKWDDVKRALLTMSDEDMVFALAAAWQRLKPDPRT